MFKVERTATDRLDISLSGKLDSDAMTVALDELSGAAEGMEKGRMLYQIGDFDFPTLGAVGVELSRLPSLLKLIGRFERAAVVADQAWLRTVSEWEGALIPGLQIRGFETVEAAEEWLAQRDAG